MGGLDDGEASGFEPKTALTRNQHHSRRTLSAGGQGGDLRLSPPVYVVATRPQSQYQQSVAHGSDDRLDVFIQPEAIGGFLGPRHSVLGKDTHQTHSHQLRRQYL